MLAKQAPPGGQKPSGRPSKPSAASTVSSGGKRRKITPGERWVLISRKVYTLAQKGAFVGGHLSADFAQAVREVDERYETNVQVLLQLTDPDELEKQLRRLLATYGFSQRATDLLLEMTRSTLKKLAEINQKMMDHPVPAVPRQVVRSQQAAADAIQSLRAFSRGFNERQAGPRLEAELESLAKLLSGLVNVASVAAPPTVSTPDVESVSGITDDRFLRRATLKAFHGMNAAELAKAPLWALSGLSEENGRKLETVLGMRSIREFAAGRLVERAVRITELADAELEAVEKGRAGTGDAGAHAVAKADGPLAGFDGLSVSQAEVLRDALGVRTVRELSENRFVRAARAIAALADREKQN